MAFLPLSMEELQTAVMAYFEDIWRYGRRDTGAQPPPGERPINPTRIGELEADMMVALLFVGGMWSVELNVHSGVEGRTLILIPKDSTVKQRKHEVSWFGLDMQLFSVF